MWWRWQFIRRARASRVDSPNFERSASKIPSRVAALPQSLAESFRHVHICSTAASSPHPLAHTTSWNSLMTQCTSPFPVNSGALNTSRAGAGFGCRVAIRSLISMSRPSIASTLTCPFAAPRSWFCMPCLSPSSCLGPGCLES